MLNELASRTGLIRRLGAGIVISAGALALAGCAAGQHAQTVGMVPPIDGVGSNAGTIAVRNASVLSPVAGTSYAKGATALLQMVLINTGGTTEQLVGASTPVATAGVVSKVGTPDTTAASATPGASDGTSTSPAAGTSAAAGANDQIEIPAGQSVQVGYSVIGPNVELTNLTSAVYPAQTVPVTLTFKSGTSLTVNLPVKQLPDATTAPTVSAATEAGD